MYIYIYLYILCNRLDVSVQNFVIQPSFVAHVEFLTLLHEMSFDQLRLTRKTWFTWKRNFDSCHYFNMKIQIIQNIFALTEFYTIAIHSYTF